MRKIIAGLLSLMLLMCAFPALAGTYSGSANGSTLFTVRYDDNRFAIDQYSYLESGGGGKWFFILYDGAYAVDCGMERTNRGAGASLAGADSALLASYANAVCQATGGSLVETYTAGSQPFVIVAANHPGTGNVYYAETVVGGTAVYFEIYCLSSGQVDSAALSTLKSVLNGFNPV